MQNLSGPILKKSGTIIDFSMQNNPDLDKMKKICLQTNTFFAVANFSKI